MKYLRDVNNKVYAFESDGSQDAFIPQGLTAITSAQADTLRTPAPYVPVVITMRQARRALLQGGYLDQVDTLIAALPGADGKAARVDWQYSSTVERTHPLVPLIASELSLTSPQLDALFTLGATL
jgi:hypothetical protein